MPIIQVDDLDLYYETNGEGHPLLLISGVGYGAWFWHKIVPGLAERYRVITFDNRGAGQSDKPAGPYSVPMMAADTAGLLDALDVKGAYIVGHSLGGFIAQELVVNYPDLVDKLILASTNSGGPDVVPITPEAMEVLTDREGDPVELVRRGITIATASGFPQRAPDVVKELTEYRFTNPVPAESYQAQVGAGAGMAALGRNEVASRLQAIQVPTLILFGEEDKVVPPGNAELLAEKIRDAQIEILPETGHIFPLEDPQSTVEVVTRFLEN